MTLGSIFLAIIIVSCVGCTIAALAAVRISGNISLYEEAGAPEGWHQPNIN